MLDPMSASQWICYEVFSHLGVKDIAVCSLVSKTWYSYISASNDYVWRKAIYREAKQICEKHFGKIRSKPRLPLNIRKILNSPCPFWPGKKVFQTHMLILIPKKINGRPLTVNRLKQLTEKQSFGFRPFWGEFNSFIHKPIGKSYWVLMTKNVVPRSFNEDYADQLNLFKRPYQVPKVLEASFCVFMHYATTKQYLYSHDPWTFTNCLEVQSDGKHLAVGAFTDWGLQICGPLFAYGNFGIGPLRILSR